MSNHDKTLKTKLNHDGPILLIRLSFSVNLDQQGQKCSFQLWVDLIFTLQNILFRVTMENKFLLLLYPYQYRDGFDNRQ